MARPAVGDAAAGEPTPAEVPDPRQRVEDLLRALRAQPTGLSTSEAQRRLAAYGPNELRRERRRSWLRDLGRQFVHPLALLLWVAAVLAWVRHRSAGRGDRGGDRTQRGVRAGA